MYMQDELQLQYSQSIWEVFFPEVDKRMAGNFDIGYCDLYIIYLHFLHLVLLG